MVGTSQPGNSATGTWFRTFATIYSELPRPAKAAAAERNKSPEAPLIGHQSSPDSRIPRRTLECFATGRIRAELRNMSTSQDRADFTTPRESAEVLFKRKEELLL